MIDFYLDFLILKSTDFKSANPEHNKPIYGSRLDHSINCIAITVPFRDFAST